jgi:hypothetical protein
MKNPRRLRHEKKEDQRTPLERGESNAIKAFEGVVVPVAYSAKQCAKACGISLSFLYTAWREGWGPKFVHLKTRRVISHENAVAWLRWLHKRKSRSVKAA